MSMPVAQRRDAFISSLYALRAGAESGILGRQSECRQTLARLRRSLRSGQPEPGVYEVVFRHDPPESEQEAWLLVAGLFATNPQPASRGDRSIGSAMRTLREKRGEAASRRFEQLLTRDQAGLAHHLRQIVRLLASDKVPVNYARLLDDLVVLLGDDHRGEAAHRTRLRWARDFHRTPPRRPAGAAGDAPASDPTT
jgi:CRISPR system Cascade subunit CasB